MVEVQDQITLQESINLLHLDLVIPDPEVLAEVQAPRALVDPLLQRAPVDPPVPKAPVDPPVPRAPVDPLVLKVLEDPREVLPEDRAILVDRAEDWPEPINKPDNA